MNEKLIKEVRKHKNIYNKQSVDYKDRKKRTESWNSISRALNMSESNCQTRWKSLRDRFVKEMNKINHGPGNSAYISENPWELYNSMQFIQDQIVPRKKQSNFRGMVDTEPTFIDCSGNSSTSEILTDEGLLFNPSNYELDDSKFVQSEEHSVEFSNTMSNATETNTPKRYNKHYGFMHMMRELLDKIPDKDADDIKVFFINYLHNHIKNNRR